MGPATYAGTVGLFEWGPTEEVACVPGAKPLRACYLERPKVRPAAQAGRRRLAGQVPIVGREVELHRIREALRDATLGKGSAVLISGEPGLGKTRIVQECRKVFMAWAGARSGRLPLWLEGRAASYSASRPYGLYQQLLSVWAGVALEENRGTVRAALLRSLKAIFGKDPDDEWTALILVAMGIDQRENKAVLAQLNAEQLQRATFEAVGAVVSRLISNGPTVLVLEDLHWADPTSLRLTEELCAVAKKGPLLLVMTSRPEPDPGVSALETNLATDPDMRLLRLQLSPLPQDAERKLVTSLLGGGTPDDIVDAVSRGAEGNPLFIEERFSSLLETRALSRDEVGWHIDHGLSVQVPEALERIVRSRVDRLAIGPRQAIVAASVLGPEFDAGALSTVTDLGGSLGGAISELCASRLLVEVHEGPGPYFRFRHSVIQEATYKGLLRGDRRRLHARAAWGLESSSSGRLEEAASQLGHHFAMAGEDGRAVHYLDMAGDHAASAYANDEAVASYRYVLDLLGRGSVEGTGISSSAALKTETDTRLKLANVLLLVGRYSEASQTLREGLSVTRTGDRLNAPRLHNKLGWVELDRHTYDAAASEFEAASILLGDKAADSEVETFDLWLQVHQGLLHVHYWRDEPDKLAAVMTRIDSAFNAKNPPRRWQRHYLQALMLWQLAERRHRVDEEILENTRKYLQATEEFSETVDIGGHPLEVEIGWAVFCLGVCLVLYGDIEAGEERLTAALRIAERTGSAAMRALSVSYLNLAALRRNDTSAVALLAPQAMDAAYMASRPQYAATAKATLAWMAWKTGSLEEVEALAHSALVLWPAGSWQPFHWVCLWPLIAVRLASGQVAEAVEAARQLLPAPQQRLPDELEDVVKQAIEAWEIGDAGGASRTLANALDLAQQLRFA